MCVCMNYLYIEIEGSLCVDICIYICVYIFANGHGKPGFNPRTSHTKGTKILLDTFFAWYVSKVKWRNPGKE